MTSNSTRSTASLDGLPIFVINMLRDTERRRHMAGMLSGLGLQAEFVTAVDGRTLGPEARSPYDRRRALRIYGVEMRDAEIGCYLSHYRLYQRMLQDGIEMALVLEDDVSIEASLPDRLRALLACPFQEWLIIRLDSKRGEVVNPPDARFRGMLKAELPGGAGLWQLRTQVLGVGAYLIRREGAARMVEYGARIFMPIDQTIDRYWENGILPYVVRPFPVNQGDIFGSHAGDRSAKRRQGQPWNVVMTRRAQRWYDSGRKRWFNLLH